MTQWFKGQLEGHYVGTAAGAPAVSPYGVASRFKLRIYRALVRDVELLDSPAALAGAPESATGADRGTAEPTAADRSEGSDAGDGKSGDKGGGRARALPPSFPPVELPEDCFYQAQIDDTRLFGIRPRSCFEGSIYDVAVTQLRVTHSTKQGKKTYGRVVGEVYGRFRLPTAEEREANEVVVRELIATEAKVADGSQQALVDLAPPPHLVESDDERDMDPLHPPSLPEEKDTEPAKVPVPLLIIAMALALGLGGGWQPALLWLGVFTPLLIIRLMMGGMFKVTNVHRVIGAILVLAQFACFGWIMLDWWTAGCKFITPWALSGIGVTALAASLLPSPVPLLFSGASFGVVLFLWYANLGATCELDESPRPAIEQPGDRPTDRPTVDDPGVPRTNDDGTWPRRGPRRP